MVRTDRTSSNLSYLDRSYASHVAVQHCAIPPIRQVLEGEHEYLVPSSSKACLQLLKYESDRYICVTMNSHFSKPEAIQGEIDDTFRDKTPDIPFQLDPTNSGQMYIAVIHFTSKYVFQTHQPYSHITVHRIDDKMKTSRLVARFEDGEELTISDRL